MRRSRGGGGREALVAAVGAGSGLRHAICRLATVRGGARVVAGSIIGVATRETAAQRKGTCPFTSRSPDGRDVMKHSSSTAVGGVTGRYAPPP